MPLVADNIQSLKPYQPGKPIDELERELGITGSIKLASNENPLGPGSRAIEAIRRVAEQVSFYPDGGVYRLRTALAERHGVGIDQVITGNGSNELLTLLARTFATGGEAVISQYGFIAYRLILQAAGIGFRQIPTRADFEQDLEAIADACGPSTRLVFLANPNNPTGVHAPASTLRDFLERVPAHVVVVLDEAYVEYALAADYESAMQMRELRERLVVCRTFSKCYGLAGLRIGYAISTPEIIGYLGRVREPFNTNLVAQAAALAALGDIEHIERSVAVNEASRVILHEGLAELGLEAIESQTNFVLIRTPKPGVEVYNALLRHGVIVRPLVPYQLDDWVRISLGTADEMTRCVRALHQILNP